MFRDDGLPMFLAGLRIGAGVAILLAPANGGELRTRLRKTTWNASENLGDLSERATKRVMADAEEAWRREEEAISDVKDKLRDKIDDTAHFTKRVVDNVVDKSKDAVHDAGKTIERGGKRLQDTRSALENHS